MNTNNKFPLEVKECEYKGEHYSAREDGMVLRHAKQGMRKRKFDDVWTWGNLNTSNGYLFISSARVHIIVATAFHGIHDTTIYVVDHIDTNRQNNRPENLRWVTRLENALLNEITRKKIELICGSIEAFLENPSILRGHEMEDKQFFWMKSVTKEEAKNCFNNWKKWARNTTATHDPNYQKRKIGDWIFHEHIEPQFKSDIPITYKSKIKSENVLLNDYPTSIQQIQDTRDDDEDCMITDSLTPLAAQYHWTTPTEFPCCPNVINDEGLLIYKENLKEGRVFTSNKYDTYYVVDKGKWTDGDELIILATNKIFPISLFFFVPSFSS